MADKETDYPFEGLSVCVPGLMPDADVEKGGRRVSSFPPADAEETPTSPENPTAKRLALAERICEHGLKVKDCEECRLMLEHGGKYSIINREGSDD